MAILTDDEVGKALAGRRHWRRHGDALVRERVVRDFAEALAFVERIGQAVEDWGRHPDISITSGNRVRVTVTNANGAGFTDAELRLVAKVDEVADAPAPEEPRRPVAPVAAPVTESVAQPVRAGEDVVRPEPAPTAEQDGRPARGARLAAVAAGVGAVAAGVAGVVAAKRR